MVIYPLNLNIDSFLSGVKLILTLTSPTKMFKMFAQKFFSKKKTWSSMEILKIVIKKHRRDIWICFLNIVEFRDS